MGQLARIGRLLGHHVGSHDEQPCRQEHADRPERPHDSLFDDTVETFGRLDAVIVNAGILFERCRVEDLTVERIERVMAVNVTGAFVTARDAARRMANDNGGHGGSTVVVSSAASRLGSANEFVDYPASKGAADTLTIGLANELAAPRVRVNAVRPGLIHTDIHLDSGAEDRGGELQGAVPMQRVGTAEETADPIVWLCSDEASYLTGTLIDVTGGR
ncbi:MAG: SDR family oxidoreductase [Actinomycetota bacterium]|nr:SDR family oxidoreductase [Actinomycetota bacterium]